MATARAFSVLYNLVAQIAQDTSASGLTNAKTGINEVIKELTRDFEFPEMLKGQYGDVSVLVPAQTLNLGYQKVALGVTDISRLSKVWYEQNGEIYELDEAASDDEWISSVDNHTNGDPEIYRDFEPDSSGVNNIQIWPGASAAWVGNTNNGKLNFSYWAQLVQLVGDSDVPNIPYELDPVLVNGGVYKVALMQGDTVLKDNYKAEYEDWKGEIRAWLIKQKTDSKDIQMSPEEAQGIFGQNYQKHGYKIG